MLLNSDSQKGQNNSEKNASFCSKTKFQSFVNYSVKQKNYSRFYSTSLNKSKKINRNPKINIIINNNNPINYPGSSSSMYINSFSDNSLRKKKQEQNSTFVFTGDNPSRLDDGPIIENYLKNPLENPIFECKSLSSISNKEQTEIIPSQEKSFFLSSSLTSNTPNTASSILKKRNNKNFIKMLKLINSESGNKMNGIKKRQEYASNSNVKKKTDEKKQKNKRNNNMIKLGFFILFIINVILYLNLLVIFFQPPTNKLFYDNDHINYKYTISSLSHEKGLVIDEGK